MSSLPLSLHLNGELPELLPGREVDDVLVDAGAPLEELLVEQEEGDAGVRLRVDGHAEVVRVAGGDAHVACGRGRGEQRVNRWTETLGC